MFKPLLKTLPSLSGNMKIACKLDGYKNVGQNVYECFVNEAKLAPLAHDLYDKNIKLNLKNNSYEYDVKSFYQYYSDVFYKTNFNYSKVNIPIIDFTSQINDNNKDFQYGCKRVSYLKSDGNQFAFYAPIYAEGLEDLSNKTFRIKIVFNKTNKLTKYIDVHISSKSESVFDENYLIDYIEKYYSKIDSKVIYCSPSYKNMYYGINLLSGGFVRIEDNISSNLYNKYYTINDFDCIINNGFRRNSLLMKQTFNLSFYFNPYNILTNLEKELFKNCALYISGYWYEGNKKLDFYDFSDNYTVFKEKVYKAENNEFKYFNTERNIMNMNYPAFNESSSENFKYVNTVAKNYNRWKLKYSNDEYPYITNLNFAFSLNQDSLYTYKEYPLFYNPIYYTCQKNSNEYYEMIFSNTDKEYKNILNEKHIASFFNVLTKEDNSDNYLDIFDPKYNGFWTDVNQYDNKVYHQGILYDFNSLYLNNELKTKIDKFSIFVIPEFSYVLNKDYNDTYKTAKFLYNDKIYENDIIDYDYVNSHLSYISSHVTLEKNPTGDFIYDETIKQYETNVYYDINDVNIKKLCSSDNSSNKELLTDVDAIDGYKLLEVYWSNNIISDLYQELIEIYNTSEYSDKSIFRKSRFKNYDSIYEMKDKLYFSIYPSKTMYNLLDNYSIIGTENRRINLYYKTKFIKADIDYEGIDCEGIIKYYYSNGLYDKTDNLVYTEPLFIKQDYTEKNYGEYYISDNNEETNDDLDENKDVIYVDIYNIKNVLHDVYGNKYDNHEFSTKEDCLVKFLNKEHINVYFNKTYNQVDNNINDNLDNILSSIFICIKTFVNVDFSQLNINTVSIHNYLCKLSDFGINSLKDINTYINYNSYDNYFYFNELWIDEKLPEYNTSENNDKYHIIKFDILFKRDMYYMDDILYKLIMENKESDNTFKDLFLYHIYNPIEYKYEMNYKIININIDDNNKDLSIIENKLIYNNIDNNETEEFDILLTPYFNTIYEEGKQYTKIYNDYFLNNIYRMEGIEEGRYRYNLPNIDIVYKSNIDEENKLLENIFISHGEIITEPNSTIPTTDKGINKYIKSYNSLVYYYNIINLYNYIINNNLDINYNINTNELINIPSGIKLDDIKYYSNNPNHYILFMTSTELEDPNENSGYGFYGAAIICKISNNIDDIYNTEIYKDGSNIGTFKDLFNNTIQINCEDNYIKLYIIIHYEEKYYLIGIATHLHMFVERGKSKLYHFRYYNNDFVFKTNTSDYINNMSFEEIPNYNKDEEERKQNIIRYSFIQSKDINFVSSYTDIINNENVENIERHNNNLITCSYNGQNYGFYFINVPFDNTKNTLNIINNRGDSINSIDYINGIDVSLMNQYSYSYLGQTFKNILPYISNSNIVKYISDNINIIVKPNIYKLYNKYKQHPNKENNVVMSYTIYNYDKKYDIELSRYFDEMVPYIPKVTLSSSYFLYYKNSKEVIEKDLMNEHISYIMYNKSISLNHHTNPVYFEYNKEKNNYEKKEFEYQLEYKHYNDNKYYCLEKEFTYDFGKPYSYKEMVEIENDENLAYEKFKLHIENILKDDETLKYMKKLPDKSLYENGILFLYKKYGRKYSHINIGGNKYTIKIKYYLL